MRACNFDSVTRHISPCVVFSVPASTFRGGVQIVVYLLVEVNTLILSYHLCSSVEGELERALKRH